MASILIAARVFAWQAASAPPEVAMGRSLEHLAHLCATHEAKIAELTEQVLRVEEHLATRDAVAQTRGEGFNPLALKDSMKMQVRHPMPHMICL